MAFSSQLLKAPSITSRPKLSKTSVSSSIFRGAKSPIGSSTTIKISKGMGYGGKAGTVDPKYLQTYITTVDQTLVETNNILIEIQRQLAFDYASRIEDEKNAIKSIKAAESKRKFAAKEKSIEGVSKIDGAIGGTISKIAAPIKGIFDKIKEFFGLILTGIVANAAFEWLKDENNVKTLGNIFTFIGKTLPFLLVGLLTYKLIKWARRFYLLARFFKRLPGKISRSLGFRSTPNPTVRPSITSNLAPKSGSLSSLSKGQAVAPRLGAGTILDKFGKPAMGSGIDAFKGGTPGRAPNIPKPGQGITPKITPGNFLSIFNPKNLASLGIGVLLELAGNFAITSAFNALEDNRIKKYAEKVRREGTQESESKKLIKLIQKELEYQESPMHGIEKFFSNVNGVSKSESLVARYSKQLQAIGFNKGGTVPGKGSRNVDSVSAMLAPGEEVIRTASARLFRPLLKDINDNAGRLWTAFSMGINKLLMVSKYQDDVNKEFSKVIEDQDRYQRNLKTKRLSEATGGGSRSPARFTPKAPKVTNVNVVPQSGGGMTFLPMVLPTQKSKPPQIPQMQSPATEAPNISSVNPGNPFMMLTPELYGIG